MTLIQAVALAKGTSEDANPRRVAVFRTIGGQRQAAAFDLTAIRRGQAPDPQIYPGDIVVVDGSSIKADAKADLPDRAVVAIFRPSEWSVNRTRRTIVNNSLAVPNQGRGPSANMLPDAQLGPGQRTYSATNILDFPTLMRIIHHWRGWCWVRSHWGSPARSWRRLLTKPVYRAWVTLEANPPTVSVTDEQIARARGDER